MKLNKILIFFVLISYGLHAQKIKGNIKEYSGDIVSNASILIKTDKKTSEISEFFLTNVSGVLNYTFKKKYNSVVYLEINALNYEKVVDSIVDPAINKTYTFNFILYPKTTQLEEVIISDRKKFNVKKDTVVFNVEKYKDGTERKVEDVLNKLPGVEVAPNGKISYKGKEVSAVNLDGDDLFGNKYRIGTKNISIDMVDQIEAIENYSKNPLLKEIENSNAVALNLKLKKNKTDYSGTSDVGYGYGDKSYADITTTLIGVSAKLKSFGVFSFSNTGNYTLFDDVSDAVFSVNEDDQSDVFSKKVINESPIQNILGIKRSKIDEAYQGSYNVLYKFSKKARIKANVNYLKDEVFKEEQFQNTFFTSEDTFNYTDVNQITQKPEAKGLDLEFVMNTTRKSLLELKTSISKSDRRTQNNFIRNQANPAATGLISEDFLLQSNLRFTYKLNKTNALQYVSMYSRNNTPQNFNTVGNFFSDQNITNQYNQFSEYRKETFQNRMVLLGRKRALKYAWTIGVDHNENPYQSFLKENNVIVENFENNFEYHKTNYFSLVSGAYENNIWKIEPSVFFRYIDQKIDNVISEQLNKRNQSFILEPSLKVLYTINKVSKLNFSGNYEQITPEENYLFSNGVLTNNRTIQNNSLSLELQKNQSYNLAYRLNDLFNNIEATAIVGYSRNENSYLSNLEINPNYTSITFFQSPINLDSWFINGSIERYLRFMQTTFKLSSSYAISEFKNLVNQSELRDGEFTNYTGKIFAKTAFRIPINFQNFFTYTSTEFSIMDQSSNSNNSIKNSFKTIIRPAKGWLFTFTYDYFKPNIRRNQDFSFLDFSLKYKPKNIKWISGRFIGKNLLDNRVFEQIENSDFSTTVYQSNLIPRYFILSVDFSF
ncbi:hypothetical protein [uncultured Aquimarina sp.]|uniref:hypothetical protein n=1 Tax=uncultured Aquimarina sp. TaxID=575652 RepID=UPI002624ED8A|nr:hypothetical protein [uncultured Aquimarina sp.]